MILTGENEAVVDREGLKKVIEYLKEQAKSIRDSGSRLPESKEIDIEAELDAQEVESLIKGLFIETPWDRTKKEAPHLWKNVEQE